MTERREPLAAAPGRDRPLLGIACKLGAALGFVLMFACVRWLGPEFPTGQAIFFRSVVALVPIVLAAHLTGGLAMLGTRRLGAHATRSAFGTVAMFCNFVAFQLLPLADATAIGFAQPMFVVILAVLMLGERVHIWRWSAVVIGFGGVMVMIGPNADMGGGGSLTGALLALAGAAMAALAMIFLRRMSSYEHSITIAFYYSLTTMMAGLATWPLGWKMLSVEEILILILCGALAGGAQLFLSYSYRYAETSLLAPFDYTAMVWAILAGFVLFGELPAQQVWIGSAVVIMAGLMILWRERRLGRQRALQATSL